MDGRDANAVVSQLLTQRLGEPAASELAGGVGGLAGGCDEPKRLDTLTRCEPGSAFNAGNRICVSRTVARKLMSMTQSNSSRGHLIEPSAQRHTSVVDQQPDLRVLSQYHMGTVRGGVPVCEIHHVGLDV
jgi:hypothetical protein